MLALLPLASSVVGGLALARGAERRAWHGALLAAAVLELVWAAVVATVVGWAIGLRSL